MKRQNTVTNEIKSDKINTELLTLTYGAMV